MKRETMRMLRRASWAKQGPDALLRWREADDILDELKRLRRIERAARKAVSMQTAEGLDAALGELAAVLKKGGRK